jgi:integrase
MAVYRKQYRDKVTGRVVQSQIWWYDFTFAGRRIQESSKSTRKTIAVEAEKKRRLELERGFNHVEDNRRERIRSIAELATEFLEAYKLRNTRSATFAEYALGHVKRLLGTIMVVDIADATIKNYQTDRLKEKAAPKSINEEVGFLLRLLGEQGDFLRAKLKRQKMLKLSTGRRVARAYTPAQKAALLAAAKQLRSRAIYPSLMLALHAGMRDAEIRTLQWFQLDLTRAILTVGDSKTEAGGANHPP